MIVDPLASPARGWIQRVQDQGSRPELGIRLSVQVCLFRSCPLWALKLLLDDKGGNRQVDGIPAEVEDLSLPRVK